MEYDPTRQEARNQLYRRLLAESGLDPKSRPALLFALILRANIDDLLKELSFSDLWGFYLVFKDYNKDCFFGVKHHLLPKCESAADCVDIMSICLPDPPRQALYVTGQAKEAAESAMQKLAAFLTANQAKFHTYKKYLDEVRGKLYTKKIHFEDRDIYKLYPSFLKAWSSSISSENELREVLRCCSDMPEVVYLLWNWFGIKNKNETVADKPELKNELMDEIRRNDHHGEKQYAAVLQYLFVDDEVRNGKYLSGDYTSQADKPVLMIIN